MSAPITIREFAKREGCDEKQVRRAITSGKLKLDKENRLDPALVHSGWRKPIASSKGVRALPEKTKVSAKSVRTSQSVRTVEGVTETDTPAQTAAKVIAALGAENDLGEAIRIKENYNALLKQLEYDKESGLVVMVSDVAKLVGEEYAKVRTRLLAIPSNFAPQIHRCKTVSEVNDLMERAIVEALEELTQGGA
ncbi:hypothetical protein [Caballeronia zhejiangensis]|uniref:hypothetical protein n=1 Tax=Caballeronia zhejiangensis TaxID=871203 RepID=UPI000690C55F|nr:hypothetical protein [Caballeronia zhejiangensis]